MEISLGDRFGEKIFEHMQKLYFHELDQRDKLLRRMQLSFLMVSSAFILFSYLLNQLPSPEQLVFVDGMTACWAYLSLAFFSSLVAAAFFVRALLWQMYRILPYPTKVIPYFDSLKEHYAAYESTEKGEELALTKQAFASSIVDQLAECTEFNTRQNVQRYLSITRTNTFVAVSYAFLVLAFLFHYLFK